jgi:hypothetical protein
VRILLDTHVPLWAIGEPGRLDSVTRNPIGGLCPRSAVQRRQHPGGRNQGRARPCRFRSFRRPLRLPPGRAVCSNCRRRPKRRRVLPTCRSIAGTRSTASWSPGRWRSQIGSTPPILSDALLGTGHASRLMAPLGPPEAKPLPLPLRFGTRARQPAPMSLAHRDCRRRYAEWRRPPLSR